MVRALPTTAVLATAALGLLLLAAGLGPNVAAASHHIHIESLAFSPNARTVTRGDTVTWHNHDSVTHDAASDTPGIFQSQALGNGASWDWVVPANAALGEVPYHCNFHPTMTAKLTIQNAAPTLALTAPAANANVGGTFSVSGTAADVDGGPLAELKVIVGATEFSASPTSSWSVEVSTDAGHGVAVVVKARLTDSDGAVVERQVTVLRNDPPVASFTVAPAAPNSRDAIQFNGTSTDDHLIDSTTWDFGDGTTSTAANATHRLAKGARSVTLTVIDDHGARANLTRAITVANGAPRANFSLDPADPAKDEAVAFTDRTDDIDGDASAWAWDFGDGATSTQRNASHAFAAPGTFTVRLNVTDAEGATDTFQRVLEVAEFATQRPVARLSAAPSRGVAPLAVTLALGGFDPDGSVANWTLDYGDGSPVLSGTGTLFAGNATHQQGHTYQRNGTFEAVLTVRDNVGATGTNRTTIDVDAPPNRAPQVRFEVAPTATPRKGQVLTFVDGSTDPDFADAPDSWDWDFGDGARTCCKNRTVSHAYTRVGTFEVRLTVRDTLGAATTVPLAIEVQGQPPAALFEANATQGRAPLPVAFNVEARDTDGRVESWVLDFGDGSAPERGEGGPANLTVRHVYDSAGTFAAQFDAFDDDGLSRRVVLTLAVSARAPEPLPLPPGAISAAPQASRFTYHFAATTTMPGASGYQWSFGDGRTATGREVDYSYDQAGTYTVTLTILGPAGPVARGTTTVGVGEDATAAAERVRAELASGVVRVVWSPDPRAAGYQVWKAGADNRFAEAAVVTQATHYDDLEVQDGAGYAYQVTFFSPDGSGRLTRLSQLGATEAFRRLGQVQVTGLVDSDGDGVGDTRDAFPLDSTRSVAPASPVLPLLAVVLLVGVGLAGWRYQAPLKVRLGLAEAPGALTTVPGLQPQHAAVLRQAGIRDTRMLAVADPADLARRTIITKPVLELWVAVAQLLQLPGMRPEEAATLAGAGIRGPWDLARSDPAALSGRLREVPLAKAQRWVRMARRAIRA